MLCAAKLLHNPHTLSCNVNCQGSFLAEKGVKPMMYILKKRTHIQANTDRKKKYFLASSLL